MQRLTGAIASGRSVLRLPRADTVRYAYNRPTVKSELDGVIRVLTRQHDGSRLSAKPIWLVCVVLLVGGCVDIRVPDHNVRFIAFGDSATAGPSTRDYPDILREHLGFEPEAFANEGSSGETSEEGLVRLDSLLADGIYPSAVALLYWEGGNDVTDFIEEHDRLLLFSPDDEDYPLAEELAQQLDATQANVESAITAGQDAGLEVFVATYYFVREEAQECDPLPLNLMLAWQAERSNTYVARLNERIRNAVAAQGAILVDVAMLDDVIRPDPQNYFNCNHLSEQGNEIVADLFVDEITASSVLGRF